MTPDETQPPQNPEPAYEPPRAEDLESLEGTAATASGAGGSPILDGTTTVIG